jgi:hypothetical protein
MPGFHGQERQQRRLHGNRQIGFWKSTEPGFPTGGRAVIIIELLKTVLAKGERSA